MLADPKMRQQEVLSAGLTKPLMPTTDCCQMNTGKEEFSETLKESLKLKFSDVPVIGYGEQKKGGEMGKDYHHFIVSASVCIGQPVMFIFWAEPDIAIRLCLADMHGSRNCYRDRGIRFSDMFHRSGGLFAPALSSSD